MTNYKKKHTKGQKTTKFQTKHNYVRIFTKTHQIVPLFNSFLKETCPINIQ